MKRVSIKPEYEAWRLAARQLLVEETHPRDVQWCLEGEDEMLLSFDELMVPESKPVAQAQTFRISKEFISIAKSVTWHASGKQWQSLYEVLWKMTLGGDRKVLSNKTDTAVRGLQKMTSEIRRDMHKMRAFVRFRLIEDDQYNDGIESYVSWFQPDHRIVRPNADFFRKRFSNMRWSILTPYECVHWDTENLTYSPGVSKEEVPADADKLEDLWRAYYRNIFNPARVKIKAMCSEMPKKYWKNLPEAEIIEELIETSNDKVHEMMARQELSVKPVKGNKYLENIQRLNQEDGLEG